MYKQKILNGILMLCLLTACKKENADLKPSDKDVNWFTVKDNPNDVLDHTIYTIYQQTGVPIFYKDTIGREDRGNDVYGKPVYYYETLNVFYSLTAVNLQASCTPATNRENLLRGVLFLKDRVLPLLNKSTYPKSFYLVDKIMTSSFATATTYQGLKTTAIGQMDMLGTMTEKQLSDFATTISGAEISSYIKAFHAAELQSFYGVSNSISTSSMYGRFISTTSTPQLAGTGEEFGFLTVTIYSPEAYRTPTQDDDVKSFILAVLLQSEQDFKAKYASSPYVLRKYDIIKGILATK